MRKDSNMRKLLVAGITALTLMVVGAAPAAATSAAEAHG